jgi:hypothetical protein
MNEVVAEAISVVGAGQDEELIKTFAPQWIWRAIIDMPVMEDNIKVCKIQAKDYMLKKPADMQRFMEIALYDTGGQYIDHVFHTGRSRIYPDTNVYPPALEDENADTCHPVDLSEDQNAFIIGSNGGAVSTAKVRYFAYPLDKDNMPMVRDEEVMMCIHKIRWMASMRENDNQSMIAENERRYKQEADRQRAKRKAAGLSIEKFKTLGAIFNRLIPDFNRSKF